MLNEFFMTSLFESKIKINIDGIRKAPKKGEAKALYKAVYEMLNFGRDADIINELTYNYYIEEARNAVQWAL